MSLLGYITKSPLTNHLNVALCGKVRDTFHQVSPFPVKLASIVSFYSYALLRSTFKSPDSSGQTIG